jgi:ankyrin repeat protein
MNKNIFCIILALFIYFSENSLKAMKRKAIEVEQGSSLIYKDAEGNRYSKLHNAIVTEDLNKVKELVENGENIETVFRWVNGDAYSALGIAIEFDKIEIIKYLIKEKKENVEPVYRWANGDTCSALGLAIELDKIELVKYLIEEQKANIESVDNKANGETISALGLAIELDKIELIKYLIEEQKASIEFVNRTTNGDTVSALGLAIELGKMELVKYLIEEQKADIESVYRSAGGDTCSALKVAIEFGKMEIVKYLIEEQKADIESVYRSANGEAYSALRIAEILNQPAIVSYIHHVENYYKNNIVDVNWPCNYFCLASFLEKIDDMRKFIKDERCVLKPEDKRSLIIGVHDRQKYKALQELFWLFKIFEQEVKSLSINKKKISAYLIQTNTFKKVHNKNFADVTFVLPI